MDQLWGCAGAGRKAWIVLLDCDSRVYRRSHKLALPPALQGFEPIHGVVQLIYALSLNPSDLIFC